MVFETLVADLVNRFLGDFIENLDKSQLSIGIWGGDVVLSNLFIKENLFNELDLPIRVRFGNVGKLTLKIPWKNLYTEPTIAILDGLYLIAVPNSSVAYNEEKERKAAWDSKQKELLLIEEAKKKEEEKNLVKEAKADTFAEKLVTNVIKNLEVKVTNIHVRYEDAYTDPSKPFSVGVTLQELSCQTTDENWTITIIREAAIVIFKLLKLDGLSVYWNCDSKFYMTGGDDRTVIQSQLKNNIVDAASKTGYLYIIEPMTSNAQLRLNTKPETDNFSSSKIQLNVLFDDIIVSLSKCQYQILMEFIESFERMQLSSKYRKYRPDVFPRPCSHEHNASAWWNFAYKCILEETVKRRRTMWSWTHIKEYRQSCRAYKAAYKSKLLTNKPAANLLTEIEGYERFLDVLSITLMRKQAEMEVKKEGKKKEASSGGWFSGWFGGAKAKAVSGEEKSVGDRVQEIMTPEEKQKLYAAIGYQENAAEAVFPKERYESLLAMSTLPSMTSTSSSPEVTQWPPVEGRRTSPLVWPLNKPPGQVPWTPEVLSLQLASVTANLEQRPAANAIKVKAGMKSLTVHGLPSLISSVTPGTVALVSSTPAKLVSSITGESGTFIDLLFETNPLDGACDTRIKTSVRPVEVIYDAKTIIALADFFKPPEDVHMVQLQAAAMAKLEQVKQRTATGLQYALQQHKFTEISVSLQPTYIIIPDGGIYKPDCRMLVLDLGVLSVSTEKQAQKSTDSSASAVGRIQSVEEIRKQAYDHFVLKLQSVQLLFAHPGDKWNDARKTAQSPLHVLRPMAINIDFFKSILLDADLPKMRIVGELPSLHISLSDQRLIDILKLVQSIPLPESPPVPPGEEDADANLNVADVRNLPIREDAILELATKPDASAPAKTDSYLTFNSIDLELKFEIKEICLALSQSREGVLEDVPILKVVIESLGTDIIMRPLDMAIKAYLGGIYLQHTQFKALNDGPLVNLINTPIIDGNNFKLLNIDICMVNRKHPELATKYNNTLQRIDVHFTELEVLLHQEAILNVIQVAQAFQTALEKQSPPAAVDKTLTRRLSIASSASMSSVVKKIERSRVGRRKKGVELIDVYVEAKMDNLSVAICTQVKLITDIKITGLEASVTLQKSVTNVVAELKDICVLNKDPDAMYTKILTFEGDNVFHSKVSVYNGATDGHHYKDMQCIDLRVTLNTGCMKVFFLNKFVQDLLTFLNQFQAAKDKLTEAGSAVKDKAALAAQDLSQKATRVALDIHLKAPVIIVPQNSKSNNAIVLDLGKLQVRNSFSAVNKNDANGLPGVLDHMTVELTLVKVYRALVMGTDVKAECLVLEPVTMEVKIDRNLSASWYHGHPDVEISGKLHKFSILVSQGDFTTFMSLLSENLQEGAASPPASPAAAIEDSAFSSRPTQAGGGATQETAVIAPLPSPRKEGEVYSNMKASFTIENVQAELFLGDSDLSVGISVRDKTKSLAKFQLSAISLIVDMLSDRSMDAKVVLHTCNLLDTRQGREDGITQVLTQAGSNAAVSVMDAQMSDMINLIFKQNSALEKDVDIKVNSLNIVVCPEYLVRLGDFFAKGMPQTAPGASSPTASHAQSRGAAASAPPSVVETMPTDGGSMNLKFTMAKPEIVLVEDSMNMHTNALILDMQIDVTVRMSPTLQTIMGSISQLSIVSCIYAPDVRESSKVQILSPVDIFLQSQAPYGKNHHIALSVTDVIINVSSASIRTLTATLSTLSIPSEEAAEDPLAKIPKDLWAVKNIDDCRFWFLKSVDEIAEEAIEESSVDEGNASKDVIAIKESGEADRGEQVILSKIRIVVQLLGGVGKRVVPFIITKLALKEVNVKDWSSELSLSCDLTLEIDYYNEVLAVWEPLIEPVEVEGGVPRPWEINVNIKKNEVLPSIMSDDVVDEAVAPAPKMSIKIKSTDIMQITITKTALAVFTNLGQSFSAAYRLVEPPKSTDEISAPYVVRNQSGIFITVKLDDSFQTPAKSTERLVSLEPGQTVQLYNKSAGNGSQKMISGLESIVQAATDDERKKITIIMEDVGVSRDLYVMRAEKRSFFMEHRAYPGEIWQVVCQTDCTFGSKVITIRSVLQVRNTLQITMELYYKLGDGSLGRCGDVEPDQTFSMPCDAAYSAPYEIFFRPKSGGYVDSDTGCKWKDVGRNFTQTIECKNSKKELASLYFAVTVESMNILRESTLDMTATSTTVTLKPTVIFRNLLPFTINSQIQGTAMAVEGDGQRTRIEAGDHIALMNANIGSSSVYVTLVYQSKDWTGIRTIDTKSEELTVWTFETVEDGNKVFLDLGVHCDTRSGHQILSLYCPYWMINRTGRDLTYKAGDDFLVAHPGSSQEIVFFLFKKSALSTKKEYMDEFDALWSGVDYEFEHYDFLRTELLTPVDDRSENETFSNTTTGGSSRSICTLNSTISVRSQQSKNGKKQSIDKDKVRREKVNKKVKASLRIADSDWSDKFSLDTVGSVGTVQCKFKNQPCNAAAGSKDTKSAVEKHVVSVNISLASTGLTKIVTFSPFFTVVNQAKFGISFKEHTPDAAWIDVESQSCVPFWPVQTGTTQQLIARIKDTLIETQPFDIAESHTTLLQLYHDYGGINVEVVAVEGAISVTFQSYCPGFASALIVNHTLAEIVYYQKDMPDKLTLPPRHSALYTWQNAVGKRELMWKCGLKEGKDELIKDGIGPFMADSDTSLNWVSFLDGMQRVLLFTDDLLIATRAQDADQLEQMDREIILDLQGIGLSLVLNTQRLEIAYFGITSSDVIWEHKKRKRFVALKLKHGQALEEEYRRYLMEQEMGSQPSSRRRVDKYDVDFNIPPFGNATEPTMREYKPNQQEIRRTFQYGISVQFRTAAHQTQLGFKIHRLQLDSQLPGAVFRTVLAPIPPPKSVAADSVPKPFAEMSVVIRSSDYSSVKQFKYCKLLVQEMAVKVDQGFLNAIIALFASGKVDEVQQKTAFLADCDLVNRSLMDDVGAMSSSSNIIKNYYDELHFSPLKIHLSFSLYGGDEAEGSTSAGAAVDGAELEKKGPQIQFNVIGLFLQSVGVVLTDIQDVVFKLAYFERKYSFYNQSQLTSEITRHYTQQAIKQMYVLVLGLDVLGNPFGVVRGLATGIEDLFYEPYQGAIQGPEEFAEGLVLGVRSLFSHAVGGAAGAVSRITGAVGKGLATLSMDDEYQKKRREEMNKRPADISEGMARSGRGLVMGVVHGVTGIVTQPVKGAREEGVGGFFKGMGKGLVGVITRPAGGVVDFASGTFETIRRATELSDEVQRLRPPRFIHPDGIIRPFVRREAEGNQILRDAGKGKFATELYLGHIVVSADERNVLLGTDRQIAFINRGDVFGHWDIEWNYTWDLLKESPTFGPKGIQVILKEKQKKLIGSASIGKLVAVADKDKKYAEALTARMRAAMSSTTS